MEMTHSKYAGSADPRSVESASLRVRASVPVVRRHNVASAANTSLQERATPVEDLSVRTMAQRLERQQYVISARRRSNEPRGSPSGLR